MSVTDDEVDAAAREIYPSYAAAVASEDSGLSVGEIVAAYRKIVRAALEAAETARAKPTVAGYRCRVAHPRAARFPVTRERVCHECAPVFTGCETGAEE